MEIHSCCHVSSLGSVGHIGRDFQALSPPITETGSPAVHLDNGKQVLQVSFSLLLPRPLGMQQCTSSSSLLGSLYPSKWLLEQDLRQLRASSSLCMHHFWSREITYILCSMKLWGETSFSSDCIETGYPFLRSDGDIGPLCPQTPGHVACFELGEVTFKTISLVFSKKK